MDSVTRPTSVVIADDHPIFRTGLRRLLESEGGFNVLGEAEDGASAIALAERLRPDVLLLDVAMPRVTGLTALKQMSTSGVPARTILLTAAIERADIVSALRLGARGILLKDTPVELLFTCIRCVMSGHYWVGREEVTDLALHDLMSPRHDREEKPFGLTRRELDIVGAIVAGYSNKEIAKKFSISEDTVKHHLTSVFDKTGVSSRLELALFAVHHKVVVPGRS